MDVDRLLLVKNMEKSSISATFFFIVKTKRSLRPFLLSLSFFKIWKTNFCVFGRKHVETEQSFLHELTYFFNYHMPLINKIIHGLIEGVL